MSETRRLGRGLEALLGPVSREQAEASGALRELPMASVKPNPYQPRTRMDEGPLDELVASIQASGLLQPVLVRPRNGGYELIAGERRWRAASRWYPAASSIGERSSRWRFSMSARVSRVWSSTSFTMAGILVQPSRPAARQRRSPAISS